MYLVDGGEQRRSFTHIDDASAGFETILLSPAANNQIFNIGNPANDTSIRGLALLMIDVYARADRQGANQRADRDRRREVLRRGLRGPQPGPGRHLQAVAFGWAPQHDLRATLESVIGWYLANT